MASDTDSIHCNPEILGGTPVVRGTRLAVDFIVGLLSQGWSLEQVIANFPGLTADDVRACVEFGASRGEVS
jgi:uncharacterized protein (DUF433 family)